MQQILSKLNILHHLEHNLIISVHNAHERCLQSWPGDRITRIEYRKM